MSAAGGAGPLRGRDFRALWTGVAVSKGGSAVTAVALPLVAVQTLNADLLTMGLLNASVWLPWLVVGLPAGAWADRVRRWPLMIACDLTAATLLITIPLAAWLGALTIGHLLLVAFATGCTAVAFTAAYHAYVPFLVGREYLLGANARLHGSEAGAQVVGPGVAGVLAQLGAAVLGPLIDAATFLVSAVCLRSIRAREPAAPRVEAAHRNLAAEIRQALGFVWRDPYLRVLAGNAAAANLCLSGLQALMVVFFVRTAGLGGWSVGALVFVVSVGGIVGATLAPRLSRRVGTARALLFGTPLTGAFGLLFPLADPGLGLVVSLTGAAMWSVGVVMNNVIAGSFRQAYCPQQMLSRVAMSIRFVIFGVMPIGSLVGSALGILYGVRGALWVLAVANVLAGSVLFLGPIRRHRDLPVGPAPYAPPRVPTGA